MSATTGSARLREAAQTLAPTTAIVIGSGLSGMAERVERMLSLPFQSIPPLAAAGVDGHAGQILLGRWARQPVLIFAGRNHFYEGHSWNVVTASIRLAAELGVTRLVLTCAAGGIADHLHPGAFMAVGAHIDWTQPEPWHAAANQKQTAPYSSELLGLLRGVSARQGVPLEVGVYAAVLGPNYETPAEIRALRSIGADAVGMSTAREAQAAYNLGMACAAVACITNRAAGLCDTPLTHTEVLEMSRRQAQKMGDLLEAFLLS